MEQNKTDKINELAERLKELLMPIDLFIYIITEEDAELIDECIASLQYKISHHESALPVIMALGGSYDSTEDIMKLETMRTLKKLINIRMKYHREAESKVEMRAKNIQLLKTMGIM